MATEGVLGEGVLGEGMVRSRCFWLYCWISGWMTGGWLCHLQREDGREIGLEKCLVSDSFFGMFIRDLDEDIP